MRRLFIILAAALMLIACERPSPIDSHITEEDNATDTIENNITDTIENNITDTINDNPPVVEEQTSIKGVWKCQQKGMPMTLD